MSKIHIAIVLPNSNPPGNQFYNSQEIGLALALNEHNVQVDIFQYSGRAGLHCHSQEYCDSSNIRIIYYPGIAVFGNQAISLGIFHYLFANRRNYSLVQVHDNTQILSPLVAVFCKLTGIPTILYQGMYQHLTGIKGLTHKFINRLISPFFSWALSEVVTKTELARSFISSQIRWNEAHIKVIPVGLNYDKFTDIEDPLESRNIDLLYVGKLDYRRNHSFLTELFHSLVESTPGLNITVIGDGNNTDEFLSKNKDLIQAGNLCLLGSFPNSEIGQFYKKAKLLVFPTRYEIFGMSILEAMYFGCVPVASTEAGPGTIISDAEDGFLVRGFCLEQWKDVILGILDNPDQIFKMSLAAHKKIITQYSWKVIAKMFYDLYNNVSKPNPNA